MSAVLEMILRSSLVVTLGLAALLLVRRQPAAFRHWILAGAVALAAAQPAINWVVPAMRVPAIAGSAEAIDGPIIDAAVALDQAVVVTAPKAPSIDWVRIATVVWLGGSLVSLGILALGAAWLTRLGARALPAGDNWTGPEQDIRRRLGLGRHVRILITTHPALLVTWGVMAPVILLPAGAAAWAPERIRLVLAHEMAHLARHDWLIQLAAELIRAVNWFNPLFWLACARLRRESEHACDDIVLDLGIGGTSYAAHLVDLARTFSVHGRTWLPAPSIARPSTLERRVRAMLNPHLDRRPVSVMRRVAFAIVLLAIAVPIAAAARAQNTTSGTVTDPSGRPLGDAAVRLAGLEGEPVFDTRTDANGNFQFRDLPAGEYMMSVRSMGFSTQRQRIRLNGGGVTITLRLPVGTLRETVTVKGSAGGGAEFRKTVTTEPHVAPGCTPSDAGGKLQPPNKVRDVRPRYKQAWGGQNLTGTVVMHATIGTDGKVKNVELVSGSNAELEEEAIASVSLWEFSPTYLNCQPVEVRMFVTVNFSLE